MLGKMKSMKTLIHPSKGILLLAVGLAAAILLSACSPSQEPKKDEPPPAEKKQSEHPEHPK
jgi:hypothetical protein